jgi:pyruvate,water dikinase
LLRLLGRELSLARDFHRDEQRYFRPGFAQLEQRSLLELSGLELLERIDAILALLKRATYYSILAPLSASLRQAVFRVQDDKIDNSQTPEVAALREIAALAERARKIAPQLSPERAFEQLEETAPGREILQQFEQLLARYGYLSQVGTDIAVSTWKEEPQVVRELFVQFLHGEGDRNSSRRNNNNVEKRSGASRNVQQRVDLKGQVTQVYSRLLAELRWCFVRLEEIWLQSGRLSQIGDIFFLEFEQVRRVVAEDVEFLPQLEQSLEMRRSQFTQDSQLNPIPSLFYGNSPPIPVRAHSSASLPHPTPHTLLQGIGASSGQVTGKIKVLHNWRMLPEIDKETILVVPYTDSGWVAPIARAGGLIAEVGGRLSHGAIVAREYGIPAVMDVLDATHLLRDGQRVRLDGRQGTIEIL